jgi:hypothetical protein
MWKRSWSSGTNGNGIDEMLRRRCRVLAGHNAVSLNDRFWRIADTGQSGGPMSASDPKRTSARLISSLGAMQSRLKTLFHHFLALGPERLGVFGVERIRPDAGAHGTD